MCGSRIKLEKERRKERGVWEANSFLGWEDFAVPKDGPAVVAAVKSSVSMVSDEGTST